MRRTRREESLTGLDANRVLSFLNLPGAVPNSRQQHCRLNYFFFFAGENVRNGNSRKSFSPEKQKQKQTTTTQTERRGITGRLAGQTDAFQCCALDTRRITGQRLSFSTVLLLLLLAEERSLPPPPKATTATNSLMNCSRTFKIFHPFSFLNIYLIAVVVSQRK